MTSYTFHTQPPIGGFTRLELVWEEAGVEIVRGITTVKGDEQAAAGYAPVFADDLRRNFGHLFPVVDLPHNPEVV